MAIPAKVARNAGGGFFAWNFRIEKDEDRGPGATQGDAEEVSFVGQGLKTGKQWAKRGTVGLVDAVFEDRTNKIAAALGECRE